MNMNLDYMFTDYLYLEMKNTHTHQDLSKNQYSGTIPQHCE